MDETITSPMDAAQGAGTLIGREEEQGRPYPHIVEKMGLILAIAGAVIIGMWIWNDSGWANHWLWVSSICALPLLTLFVSEVIGRIINKIHVGKE